MTLKRLLTKGNSLGLSRAHGVPYAEQSVAKGPNNDLPAFNNSGGGGATNTAAARQSGGAVWRGVSPHLIASARSS